MTTKRPGTHDPDRTGARHDRSCAGRADCGGTFRCSRCKRTVGWCYGMGGHNRCNTCPEPKSVTEEDSP